MMKVTYYGHACFLLENDETSVLIDPFLTDNPVVARYPVGLKPNVVLVTHAHGDHIGDAVAIAKDCRACLVSMPEIARYAAEQGVSLVQEGNMGGRVNFDFGFVKFVPAWHSSSLPGSNVAVGSPCGFVINFFDRVFYHTGDTSVFSDMRLIAELTPIDVAMVPIGGLYTMDIPEAVKAVEFIRPKVVIPMHYNTWPVIEQDPEEFQSQVKAKTGANCVVVRPGDAWEVPAQL